MPARAIVERVDVVGRVAQRGLSRAKLDLILAGIDVILGR
jgi:hypothetical protein